MEATSPGPRLALLLLRAFEAMVDEVVAGLDARGHPGTSATLEFALRAVDEGATSASELGRRLGVSKQAAAKTIAHLEGMGYLARDADPRDARRKPLRVTERGHDMTVVGAALFDDIRERWARVLGAGRLADLEAQLARLVDDRR